MGTCLRIIRGPMISMKIRFPLERSRRERQSLSSARSSGGSRSVRIKNADHHTLSERHDRHFESDLVSDAVSSQHTGAGRRDHSARKDCAQKGRTGDGASGDFLSQCLLRGKRNTMQPVYALTAGLTNNAVKKRSLRHWSRWKESGNFFRKS